MIKKRFFRTASFLASISLMISACNKEGDSITSLTVNESVQVKIPLDLDQSSVFVTKSSGRTESASISNMDMLGVLIESSISGENNFSVYGNAIFSSIPDSLELMLVEGNDYLIRSFFYNNSVDSVYEETLLDYVTDADLLNQINYGTEGIPFFDDFEIYSGAANYIRTLGDTSFVSPSNTQWPIIDHYFSEESFSLDTGFIQKLTFKQYNTRLEYVINNVNDSSRIVLELPNFVSIPISSDTTFNLDIKFNARLGTTFNDVDTEIIHDFFSDGTNFNQSLFNSEINLERLKIIRFEITAPTLDENGGMEKSGFVLVEEEFVRGDTIKIGD